MLRSLTLAAAMADAAAAQAQSGGGFAALDAIDQVKQMGRGLNIIGYDPLWQDFSKARFQDRHFRRIREGGFQTVRMNLQAFAHMNADNQLSPAWFKTLDWAVNTALANDLTVILDEHNYNELRSGCGAVQAQADGVLEQVSRTLSGGAGQGHLRDPERAQQAAYARTVEQPGRREVLAIIRKTNPTRNVIIGPANWNSIGSLDKLELPQDDRHIIVTVHYYLPMSFTHQGAAWAKEYTKLRGVRWGTDEEKRRVDSDFAGVQKWAEAAHRPILLGEFGAYDKGDMGSRCRYISYVARAAEALGWAWTYWQFDGDFIAYDMAKDDWVAPIHAALVP